MVILYNYATGKPSESSSYFLLTRRYFVLKSYDKYHKMIADIRSKLYSMYVLRPRVNPGFSEGGGGGSTVMHGYMAGGGGGGARRFCYNTRLWSI